MIKHCFRRFSQYSVKVDQAKRYIYLLPSDHRYSLIFLHGLGDSAEGFYDLFHDERGEYNIVPKTCKVILPTAPI